MEKIGKKRVKYGVFIEKWVLGRGRTQFLLRRMHFLLSPPASGLRKTVFLLRRKFGVRRKMSVLLSRMEFRFRNRGVRLGRLRRELRRTVSGQGTVKQAGSKSSAPTGADGLGERSSVELPEEDLDSLQPAPGINCRPPDMGKSIQNGRAGGLILPWDFLITDCCRKDSASGSLSFGRGSVSFMFSR